MKLKAAVYIFALSIFASCAYWNVSSLSSKVIADIGNGEGAGQIQIIKDEYALNDLSFRIEIFRKNIIVADNSLKRVQVLDMNGKPELVIGSLTGIDKSSYSTSPFNFGVIGSFTQDYDNNLYIQNRLQIRGRGSDSTSFSPSYILVFNDKGELQYTMGKTGTPDIPFFYIEKLFVDSSDRLFVISRTFNTWELYRFNKKKREKYIDFSRLEFKEKDNNETYEGKIENIEILRNGEKILLSVAYYHDIRFKYRKIYEFSLEKDKITREISTIPDPKNVLFKVVDDKIMYFWNIDGKDVKFMLQNTEGSIINNIKLDFDNKNYFSKIISNENGRFFSYHVASDSIQIYEWE